MLAQTEVGREERREGECRKGERWRTKGRCGKARGVVRQVNAQVRRECNYCFDAKVEKGRECIN